MVNDNSSETTKGQPTIGEAALFAMCPHCGERTLFAGWTSFAERCSACGLDYARFNVGDGPAAFLTMIVGAIVVALALWLQLSFEPPWWVHVILWLPLIVAGVIFGLRLAKAWLLVAEYRRDAKEHRHDAGDRS
ncbi:hypothetical protein CP97_06605 [Aurantiacibacter atlanticus]|uniref:DUF983 domain-containing protein n=1 Tax=Aurantiacibacter atlanticus TaxID=1648404 RepID=A0A0H4VXE8_9SPHN|nr:DUF983 domain-containing protein [Aurantiacibacter atlanticus]AKQ41763.1 hypothetical protein CP97_06605 [Aurantiacibacter atlanticus]MDF1833775.1 DUF983 domain-containing protein [Alteraurantiacibacter sp. bin_em_oilr2.035]